MENLGKKNFMSLSIGQTCGCKFGYASEVGQLFLVLGPADTVSIDDKILIWTDFYLNTYIEDLKFNISSVNRRLVVLVNKQLQTVARGILISINDENMALVEFVDIGEIRLEPIHLLYEATPQVVATEWKTLACILDGTNVFMGTKLLKKALKACVDDLFSTNLRFTVLGKAKDHIIVHLENMCFSPPGNINEKIFDFIDNASKPEFTTLTQDGSESKTICRGDISYVGEDGLINIVIKMEGLSPLDAVQDFLGDFSVEMLKKVLSPVTPQNVNMNVLFVAEYPVDGDLYRAKVIKVEDSTVTVEYTDFGNSSIIGYDKLFLAHQLDTTLARLRPLGKKAYMKWISGIMDVEKVTDYLFGREWKIDMRKEYRCYEPVVCLVNGDENANLVLIKNGLAIKG